MDPPRIALVTIGQAPREDIGPEVLALAGAAPGEVRAREHGALDGLDAADAQRAVDARVGALVMGEARLGVVHPLAQQHRGFAHATLIQDARAAVREGGTAGLRTRPAPCRRRPRSSCMRVPPSPVPEATATGPAAAPAGFRRAIDRPPQTFARPRVVHLSNMNDR